MKNYRIMRVNSWHPSFDDFYYKRNLCAFPYEKVLEELQKNNNVIPGSWSLCMNTLGNKAVDVIPQFELIQRHWAKENGIAVEDFNTETRFSLFLAQIRKIKPDVIFFYAGGFNIVSKQFRMYLKEIFPFIRVITGFWGDEVLDQDYSIFNDLDLVFTCNNDYKEFMNSAGIPAIVAGNCFDHLVFKDLKDQKVMNQKHDFVFAGTSGYRYNDHLKRYEDLVYQLSKSQLKAWIYEPPEPRIKKVSLKIKLKILATNVFSLLKISHLKTLKTIIETICEANVLSRFIDHTIKIKLNGPLPSSDPFYWSPKNRPPVKKLFPTKCSSPVFGLEYFSLLKSAKVVYNSSRDEAADYSNIRIFEVTGVGTCLITDKPDKIKEFFIPDEEVLTYTSNDECIEKVTYVLDHEEVRKQIATKGQARTMSEYTVTHFCEIIDKELRNFA